MPRGDRTGPRGEGPMTGGGFGYCSGYRRPEHVVSGGGAGQGRRFGGGRGPGMAWRHGYRNRPWTASPSALESGFAEQPVLETGEDPLMTGLRDELVEIRQRLAELEKERRHDTE